MSTTESTRFRVSEKAAKQIAEKSHSANMSISTLIRLSLIGSQSPIHGDAEESAEARRLLSGSMVYPDRITSILLDSGVKSRVSAIRLDDVEHPNIKLLMSEDDARDVIMTSTWRLSSATEFVAVFFLGKFISLFHVELEGSKEEVSITYASVVNANSHSDGQIIFNALDKLDGLAVRGKGYRGKVVRLCN